MFLTETENLFGRIGALSAAVTAARTWNRDTRHADPSRSTRPGTWHEALDAKQRLTGRSLFLTNAATRVTDESMFLRRRMEFIW